MICCQMPSKFSIYITSHANCQVCNTSKELRFLTNVSAASFGNQILTYKFGIARYLYLFILFSVYNENSGLFMQTGNILDFLKMSYVACQSHHITECYWSSAKAWRHISQFQLVKHFIQKCFFCVCAKTSFLSCEKKKRYVYQLQNNLSRLQFRSVIHLIRITNFHEVSCNLLRYFCTWISCQ